MEKDSEFEQLKMKGRRYSVLALELYNKMINQGESDFKSGKRMV